MEVDSVGIIAILSMSYITTRIVKTYTSVAKISRVPVKNQITTLSMVKIAYRSLEHRNNYAQAIGHDSVMHKHK